MSDETAIFKGRYVDILLTALEGLLEQGAFVGTKDDPHAYPVYLCSRIEDCLNRWTVSAPDEEPEAEPEPDDDDGDEQPDSEADDLAAAREREDWPHHKPYPGRIEPRVLALLREFGEPLSKEDIYEGLDQKQGVGAQLARMVTSGALTLNADGFYALADDGDEANPDPAIVEVEDFSDTAPVHTKAEPAAIPEHLEADAARILNLCDGEPRTVYGLSEVTDIDERDVRQIVRLLLKLKRLEKYGSEKRGYQMTPNYRVPLPMEEQGVTVRQADRSGSVESRALALLQELGSLTVEQLTTHLVLAPGIVTAACEALVRRGTALKLPNGSYEPAERNTNGNGRSKSCEDGDCVLAAEPGSDFCADHADRAEAD